MTGWTAPTISYSWASSSRRCGHWPDGFTPAVPAKVFTISECLVDLVPSDEDWLSAHCWFHMEAQAVATARSVGGSDVRVLGIHVSPADLELVSSMFAPLGDHPVRDYLAAPASPAAPDNQDYNELFDDLEVYLSLIAIDARLQAKPESPYLDGPWFGRFLWRQQYANPRIDQRFRQGMESAGSNWPPLLAGLFGGSLDRARASFDEVAAQIDAMRSRFW